MRNTFVKTLTELMENDERVFLVTADMGYFIFDAIRERFPGRFVNVGIAEANMVGIACGLALSGKIPFAYTVASFITCRAFDQIKIDICYQQANVKLVGVGAGMAYGTSGPTHQEIADIALMRSLPNMTILSPADAVDAAKITQAAYRHRGPVYIRLGDQIGPVVNQQKDKFKIGKAVVLKAGRDATIISTGSIINNALKARGELAKAGIKTRVINMHSLKPVDRNLIIRSADETGVILTLEEHNVFGGLGSIVAEVLAENAKHKVKFKRLGLADTFCLEYGTSDHLQRHYGLDPAYIVKTIKKLLNDK